jgi:3-deoxy-D-manno-octulosonate 8-phosphate phosphatase (KDO 8-P phosphatase)
MVNLLILDVDGTLTDGSIFYGSRALEMKAFSAKDGAVLKPLRRLGIGVIFLTGRESAAVTRRAAELNAVAEQNVSDKAAKLREILSARGTDASHVAYIGDDLNDYAAMKMCGFKACPSDAAREIRGICDYVSPYPGGRGAVRDIAERILKQMDMWDALLRIYGKETDG